MMARFTPVATTLELRRQLDKYVRCMRLLWKMQPSGWGASIVVAQPCLMDEGA
jgi:hypothetical protein